MAVYDIDALERDVQNALMACIEAQTLPPVRATLDGNPLGFDGPHGRRIMLAQKDVIPQRIVLRPPSHEPFLLRSEADAMVPLTSLYPLADDYRMESYVGTRATRLAFMQWGFDMDAVNWATDETAMIFFDVKYRWERAR